jgi:hypothetical protein
MRIKVKTKAAARRNQDGTMTAAEYHCSRCADPITTGEQYYEWAFRYGGKYRQHTMHGQPRGSQLTQSKMSEVLAAQEALEDFTVSGVLSEDTEAWECDTILNDAKSDAQAALDDAISEAQSISGEYQDAIDNMPASEEQNQERIDAIEAWIGELESCDVDIDPVSGDVEDMLERYQGALDEIEQAVHDVACEFYMP